jgi:hypothetical protein
MSFGQPQSTIASSHEGVLCIAMDITCLAALSTLWNGPCSAPRLGPARRPGTVLERPHRPSNTVQRRVPPWPRLATAWAGAIERLDGPSPRIRPVASLRFPATTGVKVCQGMPCSSHHASAISCSAASRYRYHASVNPETCARSLTRLNAPRPRMASHSSSRRSSSSTARQKRSLSSAHRV